MRITSHVERTVLVSREFPTTWRKGDTMSAAPPPGSFQQMMSVPDAGYRTAIAIKHEGRMMDVLVTFVLRQQDGASATYAAQCPRCAAGEIVVPVRLTLDGAFAEAPACPALCLACEDALDAILEPGDGLAIGDEPGDRATLGKYLKAMTTRSWD
jgi:hypothetical protein